jgi:hypothetical protein
MDYSEDGWIYYRFSRHLVWRRSLSRAALISSDDKTRGCDLVTPRETYTHTALHLTELARLFFYVEPTKDSNLSLIVELG